MAVYGFKISSEHLNPRSITTATKTTFARDVEKGLSSNPKTLPSKYFYDETGDSLFQQIMDLDEYYLTRSEFEILDTYKSEMLEIFDPSHLFDLVELGAGDGFKTKILIEHFLKQKVAFKYVPVDISSNVLQILEKDLRDSFSDLDMECIQDDYFHALDKLQHTDNARKIILFLGSNIGNLTDSAALGFLKKLRDFMNPHDLLLIGMDLKKDPQVILNAYSDSKGITRKFNLNLLTRINNELGGDFDVSAFHHYATYNPATGITASYLVSTEDQLVKISSIDASFHFRRWEPIHTEISRKYDLHEVSNFCETAGFRLIGNFQDSKNYFVDSVWEAR